MVIIYSNFIGNFDLGDRIVHNLNIQKALYHAKNNASWGEKSLLIKPIVLWNATILEAVLYDFINVRIKTHTREGIQNIDPNILSDIRKKRLDNLSKYIDIVWKYELLGKEDEISHDMQKLRKIQNRIHIQERSEGGTFTRADLLLSEKILEWVLKYMRDHYARARRFKHVDNFTLPWKAYH